MPVVLIAHEPRVGTPRAAVGSMPVRSGRRQVTGRGTSINTDSTRRSIHLLLLLLLLIHFGLIGGGGVVIIGDGVDDGLHRAFQEISVGFDFLLQRRLLGDHVFVVLAHAFLLQFQLLDFVLLQLIEPFVLLQAHLEIDLQFARAQLQLGIFLLQQAAVGFHALNLATQPVLVLLDAFLFAFVEK